MADGLSRGAARDLLALPDESLLDASPATRGLSRAADTSGWPVSTTTSEMPKRR